MASSAEIAVSVTLLTLALMIATCGATRGRRSRRPRQRRDVELMIPQAAYSGLSSSPEGWIGGFYQRLEDELQAIPGVARGRD